MTIPKEVLEALMKDYKNPADLIGETGLLKQLTKQLVLVTFIIGHNDKLLIFKFHSRFNLWYAPL